MPPSTSIPINVPVPDEELLHMFINLLGKAREHGKIRAKEGAGSTNEAFAHGLVQRAVREIEKRIDPYTEDAAT